MLITADNMQLQYTSPIDLFISSNCLLSHNSQKILQNALNMK